MNPDITHLINEWARGDKAAADRLMPLIYGELRRIAASQRRRLNGNITLQTTELIGEAYLRLVDQRRTDWQSRSHFFAIAATVVRRALLDHARYRLRDRRKKEAETPLDDAPDLMSRERAEEIIHLDEALEKLARMRKRQAQIVVMRYFGGLSVKETSAVMDIAPATVKRDWVEARAWLYQQLHAESL